MEEYIKILLEQIRFEKAHKAIGDEIRAHIEDQAEANISEGMDKETAEKKATFEINGEKTMLLEISQELVSKLYDGSFPTILLAKDINLKNCRII